MAENWVTELSKINQKTGVGPSAAGKHSDVPVENILAAFEAVGMSKEKQATVLASFMATHVPAAALTLSLEQVIKLSKDPTKHEELVAQFNKLTPEQQAELKAQIAALKPVDAKKAAPLAGAAVQAISKYMNNWATAIKSETDKNKKIQLAKEVVNFLADRKDTPEAQSAVPAAIAILKRSNMGPIQVKIISSLKSGLTMKESMYCIEYLLLECDLVWSDLGMQVVINEHADQIEVYDIMHQIKQSLRLT